jgi:sugar transferase (PEP-CTERM/EpsH1 system associated)
VNILFVTHTVPFPPDKSGPSGEVFHLIHELRHRHRIEVVSLEDEDGSAAQRGRTLADLLDIGVETRPRPTVSPVRYYLTAAHRLAYMQYLWDSTAMHERVRQADHDPNVDLIVIYGGFLSSYLRSVERTPVVLHSGDALSWHYSQMAAAEPRLPRKLHRLVQYRWACALERRLYPRADAVTVVSAVDEAILKSRSRTMRVFAIPLGVDANVYHPSASPQETDTVIFTGAMNYEPNAEAAARFHRDVWPLLVARRPSVRWFVVGRSPTGAVTRLSADDPRITVTGEVEDIRPWLWRSAVYVSPINAGSGMKNKILQAFACGKAVVASPRSLDGIPAEAGTHALVARTPQEFCDAIVHLLDRPDERDRLAKAARELAESYSWQVTARAHESVYEDAVRRRGLLSLDGAGRRQNAAGATDGAAIGRSTRASGPVR